MQRLRLSGFGYLSRRLRPNPTIEYVQELTTRLLGVLGAVLIVLFFASVDYAQAQQAGGKKQGKQTEKTGETKQENQSDGSEDQFTCKRAGSVEDQICLSGRRVKFECSDGETRYGQCMQ